ncbi:hypothetical protein K438DRAFT_1838705 [Mycena galopus ATCC 62051]|nr:hypothetical protein K438DRAFT_1838705 [Mycena galopus ATCC 62051]
MLANISAVTAALLPILQQLLEALTALSTEPAVLFPPPLVVAPIHTTSPGVETIAHAANAAAGVETVANAPAGVETLANAPAGIDTAAPNDVGAPTSIETAASNITNAPAGVDTVPAPWVCL